MSGIEQWRGREKKKRFSSRATLTVLSRDRENSCHDHTDEGKTFHKLVHGSFFSSIGKALMLSKCFSAGRSFLTIRPSTFGCRAIDALNNSTKQANRMRKRSKI